jgi:beta-lactamase regulating signal transducer with metallopeptidase domain
MTQWLLDTTLYTGLLIALVLVLRRPVARAFGPQIAYALWALPLLRLALPPIVLPASLAPEPESATAAPALLAAHETGSFDSVALPAPEATFVLSWSEILLPLWLGGALTFLVWRTVTYRRMRREVLAQARTVGQVASIRLVETPAVGSPVAFGVLDKIVALPPLFMAQRDLVGRDLAIAHELAHHRSNDLLVNFAAQALLALHWCNPVAWLGWRAMRRDQEAACDARVMAGHGREERARYAALIVGIAAGPRLALTAPMACPVLGEASIVHRLRSLSRQDLSPRRRWIGRAMLATSLWRCR